MIKEKIIFGIHSVQEALEAGQEIDKIYLRRALISEEIRTIKRLAREQRIPVLEVPVERLNRFTRGAHQGCVAIIAQVSYTPLEMLVPQIFERGEDPLIVLLDGVTDTRNFGAIARSAECAGAHALPCHVRLSGGGPSGRQVLRVHKVRYRPLLFRQVR